MDEDAMEVEVSEEFVSRPYQTQLEEIAISKNTIIHLPTGSGKTFIAIRLIKWFRKDLKKPWGEGGKRTFFLVNTIPLVMQQKKVIEKLIPVTVGAYSGEDGIDYWDKSQWDSELAKYEVIVMTSQILADMLTHTYIRLENINVLIFDECHHAVDDHPMRLIMKHFEACPVHNQPRVLGLTATLLNANVPLPKVRDTLEVLETTFHATIATVNELGEVLNYSTNPRESIIVYQRPVATSAATEATELLNDLADMVLDIHLPTVSDKTDIPLAVWQRDISTDPKKVVKAVRNMCVSMVMFIENLGVYGGAMGILAYIILMERLKRKTVSAEEELMFKVVITHCVQARQILLDSMANETGYNKIVKHSSAKLRHVLDILKEFNPEVYNSTGVTIKYNQSKKPLSSIIFTQQRFTAKVLYNILKEVTLANPTEFGFLKPDFIVGFNVNPMKSTREQHHWKKSSESALLKFANKELNCLISTSVIEEGVDIPQCSLVLRYDPPMEYRSYIQSKGRARSSESNYIILVDIKNNSKFESQYVNFQKIETYIQMILVGNTDDRNQPTQSDIQRNLYNEDQIPAYVTKHGTRLLAVSAVSLLNRYCSVLPHDQFTVITPKWIEETVDKRGERLKLVKIYMPISCPVKDVIQGMPLHTSKAAKRSAALNACIKLHEAGELNDITLLPLRYCRVDFEEPDVRACLPNWQWDEEKYENELDTPRAGTKKRVRKHDRVFPTFLEGHGPLAQSENRQFYLHVIHFKTMFDAPIQPRERALYDLLQIDQGYGLLTEKPLPKLCKFPLFLSVGEVETSLEANYAVIKLDILQFDLVKTFHFFIFDQVLEIAKKFVVFDGTDNVLYVVPIYGWKSYDIDWNTMQMHKEIRPVEEIPYEEKTSLRVTSETYKYSVVTPWYRPMIERYIVSNVLEYMTPSSRFDSDKDDYESYEDYYLNRYNLRIVGSKDQPLLEVRNISSRMNCLLPRAATINKFTDKQKKLVAQAQGDDKHKGFPELFVPEFCVKYDFPGVLWFKATMLPSLIHRVFMLLVAYELRAEIAAYTQTEKAHLSKGEEWLPIEVDINIAAKSMLSQVEGPVPVLTVDRINNPIDDESPRPRNQVTMKETIYTLQKTKLNKEYPWDEKSEPIDIERNLTSVTVMDIECYDEFVSSVMVNVDENKKILNPQKPKTSGAILPPPLKYIDKLAILSAKPNKLGPELRDVLAAITTINSHDTFHLERVETLGDSFLKFAASLYLFHKFPKLNEGQLTNIKGRLLGNRNLYYAGAKKQLGGRMKVEQFSPRQDFLVPGFFAPRELQDFVAQKNLRPTFLIGLQFSQAEALSGLTEQGRALVKERCDQCESAEQEPIGGAQNAMQCYVRAQAISDKSVADCVEAIIGTYLLSGGISSAVKVLEWFQVLPPQDNFSSMLNRRISTVLSEGKETEEEIDRIMNSSRDDVEKILNYKFKDPSYLLEALSHPSYIRNRLTRSYERLEFLGDCVLDFLVTSHIFENCRGLSPGELTDLRSALVNNVTFAAFVVRLGLHKHICYQLTPALENAILNFIDHQESRDQKIVEDVLHLIDEEDCQIAEYIEVPKMLSDVFESLAGAVFLDSGGDLETVWSVFYRIMCHEIDSFSQCVPLQPVRVLYERIHACPSFGKPTIVDPDIIKVLVPVTFTKNGQQHTVYGVGGNKFQAKRAAAKLALKILSI